METQVAAVPWRPALAHAAGGQGWVSKLPLLLHVSYLRALHDFQKHAALPQDIPGVEAQASGDSWVLCWPGRRDEAMDGGPMLHRYRAQAGVMGVAQQPVLCILDHKGW